MTCYNRSLPPEEHRSHSLWVFDGSEDQAERGQTCYAIQHYLGHREENMQIYPRLLTIGYWQNTWLLILALSQLLVGLQYIVLAEGQE
jgi:hypothetical protein